MKTASPQACPGQWTVVGIALGVGTGEGARPIGVNLPAGCHAFSVIPASTRQSVSSHLCP